MGNENSQLTDPNTGLTNEQISQLRRDGFDKSGPRLNSNASNWQKQLGNVEKGNKFCDKQRNGMKSNDVTQQPSESQSALKNLVTGAAIGVAAYTAYKMCNSTGNDNQNNRR